MRTHVPTHISIKDPSIPMSEFRDDDGCASFNGSHEILGDRFRTLPVEVVTGSEEARHGGLAFTNGPKIC